MRVHGSLVLICLWCVTLVHAQTSPTPTTFPAAANQSGSVQVDMRVSETEPLLGQPFDITLEITSASEIEIIEWPLFPPDGALEVLDEGEASEERNDTTVRYERSIRAVLWETGAYLAPELMVVYRHNNAIERTLLPSFTIFVPAQVDDPLIAPLRPSIGGIDLPFVPRWWFFAGATIVGLLLMGITRLVQLGRRGATLALDQSPVQLAVAQMEDLKHQGLSPEVIYAQVADQLRLYLQQRFAISAVEMTTNELNSHLREQALLPDDLRRRLQRVLEGADLVKFARVQPDPQTAMRVINFAMRWLQDVERQMPDE